MYISSLSMISPKKMSTPLKEKAFFFKIYINFNSVFNVHFF